MCVHGIIHCASLTITCDLGINFFLENSTRNLPIKPFINRPISRLNAKRSAIYINKQSLKIKWKIDVDVIEMCRSLARFRVVQCKPSSSIPRALARRIRGRARFGKLSQTQIVMWIWLNYYLITIDLKFWKPFFGVAAARVASEATPIFDIFSLPGNFITRVFR